MQKHSDLPSLKAALKQTISNMHYEHKKCGAGNSQTQSQNAGIKMSPKSSLSFQKLIDKTRAPSPIQQKGISPAQALVNGDGNGSQKFPISICGSALTPLLIAAAVFFRLFFWNLSSLVVADGTAKMTRIFGDWVAADKDSGAVIAGINVVSGDDFRQTVLEVKRRDVKLKVG